MLGQVCQALALMSYMWSVRSSWLGKRICAYCQINVYTEWEKSIDKSYDCLKAINKTHLLCITHDVCTQQ